MSDAQAIFDSAFSLITGETGEGLSDVGFSIPTGFSNVLDFAAPVIAGTGAVGETVSGNAGALALLGSFNRTVDGSPERPEYSKDRERLVIPNLMIPTAPTFLTAMQHPLPPEDEFDDTPTTLPKFPGIEDFGSANLSPPTAPTFTYEDRTQLEEILLDPYLPTDLELFEEALPDYTVPDALDLEDPEKPEYAADQALLGAMETALRANEVVSSSEQAAMVAERVEDLLREREYEIQAIKRDLAARGFFMPTGAAHGAMLRVLAKANRGTEKASTEVKAEIIDRGKKILIAAAEGGLALEAKHLELHMTFIEHLMQVRRFNVKMAANVLQIAIKLYNQKVSALGPHLNAYKAYIAAVKEQNTAPQMLARVKRAFIKSIEADVQMYQAQMKTYSLNQESRAYDYEGAVNEVKEYVAKTKDIAENVKRLRLGIDAYQAALAAYKERVEYDILRAQTNREEFNNWAKGKSVEGAQHRVRAAYIQAVASRGQRYGSISGEAAQTLSQANAAYSRYVSANQAYLSAYADKLSAASAINAAFDSASRAALSLTSAQTRVEASKAMADNQINLVEAEHATRQQIVNALDRVHDDTIRANQLAAQAKAAASVAQAAYGIFGANLNVTGVSQASETGSYNSFDNYYQNAQRQYALNKRVTV